MKKFLIIVLTLLCVVCVGIDIWALVVYKAGEEKIVVNTQNLGFIETTDGSKKTFLEINYFNNKNANGLEAFEIKYNEFADEELSSFISVGSQYVADTTADKIQWDTMSSLAIQHKPHKKEGFGIFNAGLRYYDNAFFRTDLTGNSSYYEYQSADDYAFSIGNDINALKDTTAFRITLDDEIYELRFRKDYIIDELYLGTLKQTTPFTEDIHYCYQYIDHNLFAYLLFNSMQSVTVGSSSFEVLQVGDYFEYWKFDGKEYKKISDDEVKNVTVEFNNNYLVKINVSNDGITLASQSLFNQVQGNVDFNLNNEYVTEDYLYGKSIINVGYGSFDFLPYVENKYYLKLKDSFVNAYKDYSNSIVLDICLDLDYLTSKNIEFVGFVDDCFNGFDIFECTTTETISGVLTELEVQYA
ncbi:MAG: hypothetical protein IJB98_01635 [Clostridia bacterium]|nr:hypothetical protein [Clostridia bacterium]